MVVKWPLIYNLRTTQNHQMHQRVWLITVACDRSMAIPKWSYNHCLTNWSYFLLKLIIRDPPRVVILQFDDHRVIVIWQFDDRHLIVIWRFDDRHVVVIW